MTLNPRLKKIRQITQHFKQKSNDFTSRIQKLCPPNFSRAPIFQRIDLQDQELDSLRVFFCDRVYVYTLQEKYKRLSVGHINVPKRLWFFFVREFYGDPDELPGSRDFAKNLMFSQFFAPAAPFSLILVHLSGRST